MPEARPAKRIWNLDYIQLQLEAIYYDYSLRCSPHQIGTGVSRNTANARELRIFWAIL